MTVQSTNETGNKSKTPRNSVISSTLQSYNGDPEGVPSDGIISEDTRTVPSTESNSDKNQTTQQMAELEGEVKVWRELYYQEKTKNHSLEERLQDYKDEKQVYERKVRKLKLDKEKLEEKDSLIETLKTKIQQLEITVKESASKIVEQAKKLASYEVAKPAMKASSSQKKPNQAIRTLFQHDRGGKFFSRSPLHWLDSKKLICMYGSPQTSTASVFNVERSERLYLNSEQISSSFFDDGQIYFGLRSGVVQRFDQDFRKETSVRPNSIGINAMCRGRNDKLISCAVDGIVTEFDPQQQNSVRTITKFKRNVSSIHFSQNWVASSSNSSIEVFDVETGSLTAPYKHGSQINCMSISANLLATSSKDRKCVLWNLSRQTSAVLHHSDIVNYHQWTATNNHIATCCDDYRARLWDVRSQSNLYTYPTSSWVERCDFSPDNKLFACCGGDGFRIFPTFGRDNFLRTEDLKVKEKFRSPSKDATVCVKFSHDSRYLAVSQKDGAVLLVDLRQLKVLSRYLPTD